MPFLISLRNRKMGWRLPSTPPLLAISRSLKSITDPPRSFALQMKCWSDQQTYTPHLQPETLIRVSGFFNGLKAWKLRLLKSVWKTDTFWLLKTNSKRVRNDWQPSKKQDPSNTQDQDQLEPESVFSAEKKPQLLANMTIVNFFPNGAVLSLWIGRETFLP